MDQDDTDMTPDHAEDGGKPTDPARIVAKAVWRHEWRAANPDASAEDQRAAWKAGQRDAVRKARQMLNALQAAGFVVTRGAAAPEPVAEDAEA